MARMIAVGVWGRGAARLGVSGELRVRVDEVWGAVDSVVRSLARRTGLVCCAGPRSEGTALDGRGQAESRHYACTLGRPCRVYDRVSRRWRTDGYSPEGEVWFKIPCA